ncbi:MAG: hypothetical protein BGO91_13600 [Leifsonia sp. 71-9]|nr:MAG: hypothetical protein BGO91_13600 [Leifsonia sp. 71-9]
MATAFYRDSDGHTRRMLRTGKTPQNAEDNLKRALKTRLAPEAEGITPSMRISALADEWWEEWLSAKPRPINTERRYKGILENHIKAGLGGLMISEASVSRLDRFLKAKTKNVGYSSAALARVILRGMMGMAARHGAIMSNPVDSCATIPEPEKAPVAWSLDEIADIRTTLAAWDSGKDKSGRARSSDLSDPCDFMLGTGCRPGEVFALRWADVDLESEPATARIRATVVRDRDFGLTIQEHTKGHKVRILKLPLFVVDMLRRRSETAYTEVVFPSSTGTVRSPDNFRVQWNQALGDVPIVDAMPKVFRSSVGTFVAKTASKDSAQKQLGHSSVTITEKHYIDEGEHGPDLTATLELLNTVKVVSDQNSQ